MEDKIHFDKETKTGLVLVGISMFYAFIFMLSRDIFWTLLFIFVFGLLFYLSSRFKNKLLLRLISLFGIFHLVIFPYIYVLIIHLNSDSFKINQSIVDHEKNVAINEIVDKYDPEQLDLSINLIDSVLNLESSTIDTTLSFLLDKNILITPNFIFHRSSNSADAPHPQGDSWSIVICDTGGRFIFEVPINRVKRELTIYSILEQRKKKFQKDIENFSTTKQRYDMADIWKYSRILWYSINIFDSKHLVPNSRGANVIFFLHRFIIYLLLAFIGKNTYDLISKSIKE